MCKRAEARQALNEARMVADYARLHGGDRPPTSPRPTNDHIGAVLADSVLQAGVRYETVVRPRVTRIVTLYPEAQNLDGLGQLLTRVDTSEFLMWRHPIKVKRFERLVEFFDDRSLNCTETVAKFLDSKQARTLLLELNGVGPKTYDYLCNLLGLDRIAVDRHVITFASEAGVIADGYEHVQRVTSYAADLLGIMRRDFDAWMWHHVASRNSVPSQLALDF
jgi:3-methyladenine DNA glycosylase/8-oxoguanine DNA glycosylase